MGKSIKAEPSFNKEDCFGLRIRSQVWISDQQPIDGFFVRHISCTRKVGELMSPVWRDDEPLHYTQATGRRHLRQCGDGEKQWDWRASGNQEVSSLHFQLKGVLLALENIPLYCQVSKYNKKLLKKENIYIWWGCSIVLAEIWNILLYTGYIQVIKLFETNSNPFHFRANSSISFFRNTK